MLQKHSPKSLSNSATQDLESPLSVVEVTLVLKQLKPGKSPGPDGLTVVYYKIYADTLIPHFLKAFNSLASRSPPPRDLLEAHITVIPKPGKHPSLITIYRPISLLNIDLKLYAKILANRLLPLLPKLISLDQMGFIPGREARDNTLKAINIHHCLTSEPYFFLSLEAENAFDGVAWDYMAEALKAIGLQERILNFILALFSSPTARVQDNSHLSNDYSISKRI